VIVGYDDPCDRPYGPTNPDYEGDTLNTETDAPRIIEVAGSYSSRNVPTQQPQANSLVQALAIAASDPRTDMDKMERLFAMHQTMLKQEAETAFNDAMSHAQAKIQPIAHNALNTHTGSKYAKLAAINKAIVPIYTAEGLSISFNSADSPKPEQHRIIALVSHSGGHTRQYHIDLALDSTGAKGGVNKTAVQATGSTNAYARRYLTLMIFNVSTEDDNDGNKELMREMDAEAKAQFFSQIEALKDLKSADVLWAMIADECTKAGDVPAYDELKAAMAAQRKALKKAETATI
jgi:hypothetical protein